MTAARPLPEGSPMAAGPGPAPEVLLADVTLREHGQNLTTEQLARLPPALVIEVASLLAQAGIRRLEVFSCVSPRVAPAMSRERLRAIAEGLGPRPEVTFVTLVPNRSGFESFLELGLGPEGLGHHAGLFFSAVEEHNRANLGRGVEESLEECRLLAAEARTRGVPLVAYLSAAFGFVPPGGGLVEAPVERLLALIESLRELGASTVTLSDLQGVRSPEETGDRLGALLHRMGGEASSWLGYHGHHSSPEGGVALAEAAFEAGVRLFDGSLGAVGGCVTGAPGNAPTEGLVGMLGRRGARHGVDSAALERASACFARALRPL